MTTQERSGLGALAVCEAVIACSGSGIDPSEFETLIPVGNAAPFFHPQWGERVLKRGEQVLSYGRRRYRRIFKLRHMRAVVNNLHS
jgi:hypothetical protein